MAIDLDELTAELIGDESIRRTVYDDATGLPLHPGMVCKGHPTIGVGRALDVHGLSPEEIKFLLRNDATEVSEQLFRALPWFEDLEGPRQCAIANMAFNLGVTGLLGFHDTLSLIAAKNYDGAASAMLASKWAGQVGARAKRIAEQIKTGRRRSGD
jgi:lysozyme